LFANFAEAIEITAIQRGVERWQPENFVATGMTGEYACGRADTGREETPKIKIRFFPDLEVACGAFKSDSSSTDYDAETIEIENVHGNLDPERHFAARASGNSMDGGNAPVKDGDILLLEKNEGGTVSNQVFAVEYRDEFGGTSYVLKRVEKDAPGRYRLVSANKAYEDIPVDTENIFPFARLIKNLGKLFRK
jgi:hypothetical protein